MKKTGFHISFKGLLKIWIPAFAGITAFLGITHADFEDLGVHARAIAMGGAMTALADDAQSAPLNPAGLGYLRRAELGSDYGRLMMGLEDDSSLSVGYLSLGIPLSRHKRVTIEKVVAPSGSNPTSDWGIDLASGSAPGGGILKDKKTISVLSKMGALGLYYKKFSLSGVYEESTFGLAWGKSISRRWCVGLGLKSLGEKYSQDDYTRVDPIFSSGGKESVSAISADIGVIFNLIPRVFLGYSALDLNQPDVGLSEKQSLPRTQKLGLGYRHGSLQSGLDYTQRAGMWTVGSGLEKFIKGDRVALRGGILFGKGSLSDLTAGLGFKIGQARLDYSVEYPLSGVEKVVGNHRVSIIFKFGEPQPEEAEPGSLEQAYLMTRDRLLEVENKLVEVEENRNTLEKVLVEESTQRIQERIESARALARSRSMAKENESGPKRKTADSEVKVRTHRVERGDTLQSLAEKFYGDRSLWRIIYEENKDLVGRGGAVKSGLLLVIPPAEAGQEEGSRRSKFSNNEGSEPAPEKKSKWSKPSGKPEGSAPPSATAPVRTHIVQQGETLQALAQKYYGNPSEWQKIYSANKERIIRGVPTIGAELVIP